MITLNGHTVSCVWTLHVGDAAEPIARVKNLPIPREGETIFHEEVNGPLTVKNVVWNVRQGQDLEATVYAQ